jgi:uncharacterized membrane protein YoaK (UPF0700 family)
MTETAQPDTLVDATLLACTGGVLDAVVYTLHGHVFANAATGNVILLGVSAFSKDWRQAARHLAPILAFVLGVAASRLLRRLPQFRASLAVLMLEMVVLFAAGLLKPSFPEMAFTAIIAFVSAFQVSTFRLVGRFSYNSTFITGNLREAAEGFVGSLVESDPHDSRRDRAKARKMAFICLFFLCGAMLGAWGGPHFGNRTLWLVEPLLLTTVLRVVFLQRYAPQLIAPAD